MTLIDWFSFLFGNEQAILHAAGSGQLIWVGAMFVLTAGVARTWRGKDLLREPRWLLFPFVASAVSCLALTVVFSTVWFGFAEAFRVGTKIYVPLLTMFWLTGPLAWFYGMPFERFGDGTKVVRDRLLVLLAVSIWRVMLTIQILFVLFEIPWRQGFLCVCFFSSLVAIVAILAVGRNKKKMEGAPLVIGVMGGIQPRHASDQTLMREVAGCLTPTLGLGGLVCGAFWLDCRPRNSIRILSEPLGIVTQIHWSLWAFAGVALFSWGIRESLASGDSC